MVELIIQLVNIFLLSMFLGYILSPMIGKMLSKRKHQIRENLHEAKSVRQEALDNAAMYEEKLADFDKERGAILARAQEKAKARENDIIGEANAEAGRIIDRAQREATLMRAKIKDDIKKDMVTYASAAAAKLIAENMDVNKQDALIEQTLNEMGDKTWQN